MLDIKRDNKKGSIKKFLKWFFIRQESSIIIVLVLYSLIVTLVNPVFISTANVINILRSTGFTLIMVVGMTFVLITAGLDLSVGAVFALGAIICGLSMQAGIPIILSILLGMLSGLVIGIFIGTVIVKTGIPPLIVTLGMMYVCRGLVSIITKGVPVYPLPEQFMLIEQTKIFNSLPVIILISVAIAVIGHIILSKTVFGRSVYAIGGNEEAAKISGINITKVKMAVYIMTSTLAAISGILMSSRLGSAEPAAGTGIELKVIAGSIIGGISTFGGMGTILGASLGALFMEVMTNSLTLMKVSVYWQNLVFGVILIASVLLDQYKRRLIIRQSVKAKD
ncbi:MAG TPA: ABC transporter permease [Clostridiaceae bacterium]|nr:ABC transporter permease [Clostridiaceae bacterium]